jgi:hypothetical protein
MWAEFDAYPRLPSNCRTVFLLGATKCGSDRVTLCRAASTSADMSSHVPLIHFYAFLPQVNEPRPFVRVKARQIARDISGRLLWGPLGHEARNLGSGVKSAFRAGGDHVAGAPSRATMRCRMVLWATCTCSWQPEGPHNSAFLDLGKLPARIWLIVRQSEPPSRPIALRWASGPALTGSHSGEFFYQVGRV